MKVLLILIFGALSLVSLAGKIIGELHADDFVDKLSKKNFLMAGSLERMKTKNRLSVRKKEYSSLSSILKEVGFDGGKCFRIEGTSINGWGIDRYKVSGKYDIYVNYFSKQEAGLIQFTVICVFIAPHRKMKFDAKLFSGRRWSEILF